MKYLLPLGLTALLVTSFFVSENAFAFTSICTASNPCNYRVCGDHICSQGEFENYMNNLRAAQRGFANAPSNMTGGNMPMTVSFSAPFVGSMIYEDLSSDGTLVVVSTNHPMEGNPSVFGLGFFSANGSPIPDQNYAITITQKDTIVFSDPQGYASTGINILTSSPMPSSNDPLSLVVTLKGVGLPSADPSTWTGVKGEILNFAGGPHQMETNSTIPNQSGVGQQGGIPLGTPYTAPANITTAAPTTPPPQSQAPQYGVQAPASNQSGVGQQGGIPLGTPYTAPATTTASNPYGSLESIGWGVGMAIAAIMTGIGVWSAGRRR